MPDDILVNCGGSVKAVGDGRIQGYLVQYSDADNPDLSSYGDFFAGGETDFDFEDGDKRSVYFHHGFDGTLKSRKLGRVEMKADDVGIWVDGILDQRDEYEKALYELAAKGKLSWSSGAPNHLVQREKIAGKSAHKVTHWPIAEASLEPAPADYRNTVIAIKAADVGSTLFADLLREIEGKPPAPEIKSVLGDMTPDIAAAAFDRLSSRLSNFVYQQLWGDSWGACCYGPSCGTGADDDPEEPVDRAAIAAAVEEYGRTLLAVLDALLSLPKADPIATKSFLAQFDKPGGGDVVTLLSAMPIKSYLKAVGSVAQDADRRIAWYADNRAVKSGRTISADNLSAMSDIADGMDSAHATLDKHRKALRSLVDEHSGGKSADKPLNTVAREFTRYLAIGAGAHMNL